ncbi:ATP synthase F1 subunit gamma [Blattabacterium cuenoti]|uniref:ATP synthase F1 subunit gamma n=1 Tax=Blattabacterium cuenoti TaxID=1653831 RepID=UPI00163C084F|nr:ATP synthase F1 subunit gamma [Blattabacterium cuenoti]
MSNPKEIKKRILSIESVIKTTEAMKMISIVKLRKTKDLLTKSRIYLDHIEVILLDLLFTVHKKDLEKNQFFSRKKGKKLFIVFTSDRGLCGSFNSLIFEKINFFFQKEEALHKECLFLSIGKKGFDFLCKNKKYNIYKNWIGNDFSNREIQFLVSELILDFFKKNFSEIYLIYNCLKQSLFQEIVVDKFLPIPITYAVNFKKNMSEISYILEPTKKKILNFLIPKFLNSKLLKILLESTIAEHTARMISMHKATENASDIKHDLILNYNKERQTTITKEILEIISGLESLNKKK